MLPNHGSVQGELFPGSVVCDARTQGLHEGPFTVIFKKKVGRDAMAPHASARLAKIGVFDLASR